MTNKIHRCKEHNTPYTVCQTCKGEYCEKTWPVCPRISWHPAHGKTAEDMGNRYAALQSAREQSEANLKAMGR